MSKKSGFQIVVRAFIAADAFDAASLAHALAKIMKLKFDLSQAGFVNIEVEQKSRHRVEVAEEPTVGVIVGQSGGTVEFSEVNDPNSFAPKGPIGVADDPLAIPPHLDRRNRV